ncbi:MAG: hypothetical protein KGL91_08885 [Xanthomonadaceae bacterium]|nr:hypothetical protein [Xanthomonadaceae bacterium]
MKIRHLALLATLSCAPAAHAQQWLVNNAINNQIMDTAICDSTLRKHERLPDLCAKYPRHGGRPASPTATLFTPVAGGDAVKQLADSLGNSPEERRQILQLADAGKEMFALKYKGKWNNTIAGAMTFFIAAVATVQSEREPDADAQQRLFDSLNASLAKSDIARAPDKDKTALYDTLLAVAGLPLVFYVDGKQHGNAAQVEQAKAMAAGFSRKLLHVEPQVLGAMLSLAAPAASTAPTTAAASGSRLSDGHYDCLILSMTVGASFSTQYQPTGMGFAIAGNTYSASAGGGTVAVSPDVVAFRGGAYDGWQGARLNGAIVFRKNDHSNPQAGEGIRAGDFRCARTSG